MDDLRGLIENSRHLKTLYSKQKWLLKGYTVVPNRVFEMNLSSQALHLFLLLLRRLFQKDFCFPNGEILCKELSLSRPMITKYKAELVEKGMMTVDRLGQGRPNRYYLIIPDFEADVK